MSGAVIFDWVVRIVVAILIFLVFFLGVPWVLGLFGGPVPPDNLMKAIAALIALAWLLGEWRYGWVRTNRTRTVA